MQRSAPIIPIQLDSSIAIKISMGGSMFQERNLMGRSDVWHQIKVVKGAQFSKEKVLKLILNAVEPADLIPIKYQVMGEDSFFMARNCGPALDKLCKTNLLLKDSGGVTLILQVTLGYASIHDLKVNVQPVLITVLNKRFNLSTKTLDLDNFHNDPELSELVYCPLSLHRSFGRILKLASENCLSSCERLNLQKNELFNITALENYFLGSIKYLDLRHNNLANMDILNSVKNQPITKLWLDGNPLCENYIKKEQYAESAKKYCSGIIQLDGVFLGRPEMPGFIYPNYFKDRRKEELTKNFVTHFFNFYDQGDRSSLKELYREDAMYSMSCGIPGAVAQQRKLSQYTANRNLIKQKNDPAKRNKHLYCGQDNILIGLKRLPQSYHDTHNLIHDLIYDDDNCLVLSICGYFKSLNRPVQVLYFHRTFVLLQGRDNEYKILNDQYYIDAAPEGLTPDKIEIKHAYEIIPTMFFTESEKKELTKKFAKVSTLNSEWCSTYLQEASWDLRKALENFMKDYKCSAVPIEAFHPVIKIKNFAL